MSNNNLLQYVCCPTCKSDLVNLDSSLACEGCRTKYNLYDGIPVLVDLNSLSKQLKAQIDYFEKEDVSRPDYRIEEWHKSYLKKMAENMKLGNGNVLIDVGTGSGYVAVEMAKKGMTTIACDLTLKELVKLKKVVDAENLQDKLLLVCCSADSLPFKEEIADCVVANAVLEHLSKEGEAIAEISRVCKKASNVMITVPLQLRYNWPMFWVVNYIHDVRIGHLRRYDEKILLNKFNIFGFKIKRTYYTGHLMKVFKILFNDFIFKVFDLSAIETQDGKLGTRKYGASNVCVIFER